MQPLSVEAANSLRRTTPQHIRTSLTADLSRDFFHTVKTLTPMGSFRLGTRLRNSCRIVSLADSQLRPELVERCSESSMLLNVVQSGVAIPPYIDLMALGSTS